MANKYQLTDQQKLDLLNKQFQLAMNGDTALLIHLGQTELGQIKEQKLIVETLPMQELTTDQLIDAIRDRMIETGQITANQLTNNSQLIDDETMIDDELIDPVSSYNEPIKANMIEPADLGPQLPDLDDWEC